jgi:hypothetical protein
VNSGELSGLNRNQLRQVMGLLTGKYHMTSDLFKMGLLNRYTCKRCHVKNERPTHVLCDCDVLA